MDDKSPYKEMKAYIDNFDYHDWEETSPTSVKKAKEQIAICLLFFMKNIYDEFWYHGWKEPTRKKFDKAAQEMFNHLAGFVKSGKLRGITNTSGVEKIPKNPVDRETFQEEELELEGIRTLRDYLVIR